MMKISDAILAELTNSDECTLINVLDQSLPKFDRRKIIKTLIRLKARKLVDRESVGCYFATPAGHRFVESGQTIKSGPSKRHTGPRQRKTGTMVIRLWQALRAVRKGTLPQLVSLARNDQDGNPETSATTLLNIWEKSGFITRIGQREKGTASTSPGHIIWFIVRDNGPKAPLRNQRTGIVTDTNSGEKYTRDGDLIEAEVRS